LSEIVGAQPGGAAVLVRRTVVVTVVVLIALVASWCIAGRATLATIVIACVATSPLWLGLSRLVAGQRRTYAWMTLVTVPYLVLAITEAVANPAWRTWAGACLLVTLLLFALLVTYLRVTRRVDASPPRD
jgi:uncharacterized membrane protein